MKTGHFEMVTMLLAAMILMDIFQVKAEMLDMADNTFDDEYLKCIDRMETKYVPQLLTEEKSTHQVLQTVWENAKAKWEAQKVQLFLPLNFKDNHGIALTAYVSEYQQQTPFYHLFNEAVKMAGKSRKAYIYDFQFKAFHFYLTRALQLLRRPCEESYKNVVYRISQDTSFTFGELNQARLSNFTMAYSAKPQTVDEQQIVLTIHTCFGIAVEKFFDKENEKITLIPLSEVFQVSREGDSNNLILQSTNKTCSHYECAFLGGNQIICHFYSSSSSCLSSSSLPSSSSSSLFFCFLSSPSSLPSSPLPSPPLLFLFVLLLLSPSSTFPSLLPLSSLFLHLLPFSLLLFLLLFFLFSSSCISPTSCSIICSLGLLNVLEPFL
uniref:NAD(P)(+)--arginine ADP-ribosyltransferase n=1 Tax=Spermophilus dauricus TaxID=99837 RepID=A0A8C9PGQ3_SPEDA